MYGIYRVAYDKLLDEVILKLKIVEVLIYVFGNVDKQHLREPFLVHSTH